MLKEGRNFPTLQKEEAIQQINAAPPRRALYTHKDSPKTCGKNTVWLETAYNLAGGYVFRRLTWTSLYALTLLTQCTAVQYLIPDIKLHFRIEMQSMKERQCSTKNTTLYPCTWPLHSCAEHQDWHRVESVKQYRAPRVVDTQKSGVMLYCCCWEWAWLQVFTSGARFAMGSWIKIVLQQELQFLLLHVTEEININRIIRLKEYRLAIHTWNTMSTKIIHECRRMSH